MSDWYRRKTWTKTDQVEFFAKLGRARKNGRAQYLKIQAMELVATKDRELINVAVILLNKMLIEYPNDDFNKGGALYTLGNIYEQLEDHELAIRYYKQAIDFEKVYPNLKTDAYLNYSELIVRIGDTKRFSELENILTERYSTLLFPIEKYKVNSILSIIFKYKNDQNKADYFTELADQNADAETSGLRYHKYLGVVKERETWLDKLVRKK